MGNPYFKFKQFTISQENTAMKVGVDGVLLGSWIKPIKAKTILDIGTGTGLLSLMLAQKSLANITAIEIDINAASQAKANFENSKWSKQIDLKNCSIQEYAGSCKEKFDLIVCNPPYFTKSLNSNNTQRNLARHDTFLPLEELMSSVNKLLTTNGSFFMIYPFDKKEQALKIAPKFELFPKKLLTISGNEKKAPNRFIVELGFERVEYYEDSLIVRNSASNNYTDEYKTLTKDYYLAF